MAVTKQPVLEIVRTAAADCGAQGNTMARNELLDAANVVSLMVSTLRMAKAREYNAFEPSNQSTFYGILSDVLTKAEGAPA